MYLMGKTRGPWFLANFPWTNPFTKPTPLYHPGEATSSYEYWGIFFCIHISNGHGQRIGWSNNHPGTQIQSPISSSWEASRFRRIAWNATGFSNHPNLQCSSGRSAASLHWPGWRPEVQNTLGMPKGLLYIVYSAWTHLYMWYIYMCVKSVCVGVRLYWTILIEIIELLCSIPIISCTYSNFWFKLEVWEIKNIKILHLRLQLGVAKMTKKV